MKHTRSLMAYVYNFDTQKNAKPNMDKFSRKFIFLGGLQSGWWTSSSISQSFPKNMVDIIKIIESNLANGSKIKLGGTSQNNGVSQNMS